MERTVPPSDQLERRIRAAAGYSKMSIEEFADATTIGKSTLYRVFSGKRHLKRMELREIAVLADLPVEFFFADFALLAAADGATRIAQAMDSAAQDARDRQGESPEEPGSTENPSP